MSEKIYGRVMIRNQRGNLKEPEQQNNVALAIFHKVELNPFHPKQGFDSKTAVQNKGESPFIVGKPKKVQD